MSEFPEWVERQIGWSVMTYDDGRALHRAIRAGQYPDPRGSKPRIWWRQRWPFNRRSR